jgi:hypothetical protein
MWALKPFSLQDGKQGQQNHTAASCKAAHAFTYTKLASHRVLLRALQANRRLGQRRHLIQSRPQQQQRYRHT